MERVRPRLGHHIDGGARIPSLFGLEQIGLNLELLYRLYRRPESDQTVAAEVVIDAIEHEVIRLLAVSIGEKLRPGPHVIGPGPAANGAGRGITNAYNTGTEDR